MPRFFSVVEPHPTVPKSGGYIGGGRGGAGNFQRYKAGETTPGQTATGPASRVPLTKPVKRTVPAGRGGAGNMVSETEESIFQFDEEMVKTRETSAPVYHVGRGGAGNLFSAAPERNPNPRKDSDSSSSDSGSTRSGLNRAFSIFSRRSS